MNMYDEKYSGLINSPFPLNFLVVPFLPIYFFSYKEEVNTALMVLEHAFLILFIYPAYLVISFSLIPVAYVKCLTHKIILHRKKLTI